MKRSRILSDQSGAVLVIVALLLVVLVAIAAFAIDIGHLMVVRNQLQNAADAGALAGARVLYTTVSGTHFVINTEPTGTYLPANTVAMNATIANWSDRAPVEVLSVQKGHWCFRNCPGGTQNVFTPNDDLETYDAHSLTFPALDADTGYVNAVRVVAARGPAKQAASFFAGIFGISGFSVSTEAVAWLGFAGSNFKPDAPIVICKQSVMDSEGNLNCSAGKMINAGSDTGAWTNLEQGACDGASSVTEVRPLICADAKIAGINLGYGGPLSTIEGEAETLFTDLRGCWRGTPSLDAYPGGKLDGKPDRVWSLTLPMVDCGEDSTPTCKPLIGALKVEIFWITENGSDPKFTDIPPLFDIDIDTPGAEYSCPEAALNDKQDSTGRKQCWLDFLNRFGVKDANGNNLTLESSTAYHTPNTIFFKPSCTLVDSGSSGGAPSNVMAKKPKLVR